MLLASKADDLRRVRGSYGGENRMTLATEANSPARRGVVCSLRGFRALGVGYGYGRDGTGVKVRRDGVGVDEALLIVGEG